MAEHRFRVRVYYEDTDCMGVVYHANYLRYFERARSEALAATGRSVADWAAEGALFVVYKVNLTYKAPARLFDELEIVSTPRRPSPFRVLFEQRALSAKDGRLLVEAQIELACLDSGGRPREIPELAI